MQPAGCHAIIKASGTRMEAILNQLLSIVTNYPSNLTYHLVVSFGIALALGGA